MTTRALSLDDIAREFGRSREWMADNWRDLVAKGRLPAPLVDEGRLPTWSAAQVYAVMDKKLSAAQRAAAAAFRAALDAAHTVPAEALHHDEIADARAKLDRRFGGQPHG